jgi:large subunit ribosomal protein LP1
MATNNEELACTYAALLLHDGGVAVTADLITKIATSANVKVSSFWPSFYEQVLKTNSLDAIIANVGTGGGMFSYFIFCVLICFSRFWCCSRWWCFFRRR